MSKRGWITYGKRHFQECKGWSDETRMPWGEYEGRNFDQIPREYLEKLLTDDACKEEWKGEIAIVFDRWNKQINKKKKSYYKREIMKGIIDEVQDVMSVLQHNVEN